jgi:nucleoside-diphosphate-sugar epimerase
MRPGEHPAAGVTEALQAAAGDEGRLVLVIDQFEELFAIGVGESDRGACVEAIVAAAADPDRFVVVIGLRADFYGHCAAYPELARLLAANQVLVGPMRDRELRRAIELPARRVGDPTRARELLGFEATTTLETGVRKLIEWRKEALKNHGN